MNIKQAKALCRTFPGATEDTKWGADLVFSVGAGNHVTALKPPSTTCEAPVMNDALSEHIQTTASAISSALPRRCIGTLAMSSS